MIWIGKCAATTVVFGSLVCGTEQAPRVISTAALASPAGDACRKEICDGAVAACMQADLSSVWFVRSEADKKTYCGNFFVGCMNRSIYPNRSWYSPETVTRLMRCPS